MSEHFSSDKFRKIGSIGGREQRQFVPESPYERVAPALSEALRWAFSEVGILEGELRGIIEDLHDYGLRQGLSGEELNTIYTSALDLKTEE